MSISWFLCRNLQARRGWYDTFKLLKRKNLQPRICYPAASSFRLEGKTKNLSDKQKTKDFSNRTGETLLEGTNKTLGAPGPRRKEQWPHKRLTQTCLWVSRSLRHDVGQRWPAAGSGHWGQQCLRGTLWRTKPIIITSTIVWPQVKQQGGGTALSINRKLD